MQNPIEFWNDKFSKGQTKVYSRVEMPAADNPILKDALRHFGNIEGKTVVDLGCGGGKTSLFFASRGANVISIDSSEVAIRNLSTYIRENGIRNISPVEMRAQEIAKLGSVDFIFGSMILHHIEPFAQFARDLRKLLKPGGKGFFWENNARSKTMIWFRQNIVGKLWVPKYGDEDEFPLMPSEVDEIRKYFHVSVEHPELLLFRLVSTYLLRGHLRRPFKALDDYFYKFPRIREYSYRQYVRVS
jgi:2-polyprenyl-3-methyl-5-hydroxy-6-metoxy-1,4-benzoquinol methylase